MNLWRALSTQEDQMVAEALKMKDWAHFQPRKPWLAPMANEFLNGNAQAKHLRTHNHIYLINEQKILIKINTYNII